jgi:hypothetical protein
LNPGLVRAYDAFFLVRLGVWMQVSISSFFSTG